MVTKILLVLVAVIVIAVPVRADDFLDSLYENAIYIRQSLGIDSVSSVITDGIIYKCLRESYVTVNSIANTIDFYDTLITAENISRYALDTHLITIDRVSFKTGDSIVTLQSITPEQFAAKFPDGYTLKGRLNWSRVPRFYMWGNGILELLPSASRADTILIVGRGRIDNIMSDVSFCSDMAVRFRIMALNLASAKVANALGRGDDRDFFMTLYIQNLEGLGIIEAKKEK